MREIVDETVIKHDAHAREYYVRVVNEWLASPFVSKETPQMWLTSRNDPKPPKPVKKVKDKKTTPPKSPKKQSVWANNPHVQAAPASNGSTFLYVVQTEGELNFTGFGTTAKPAKRVKSHISNLRKSGSDARSYSWFEVGGEKTAKVLEATLTQIFPIVPQPVESFKTEATAIELHDAVVAYVQSSLDQRNYFSKFMTDLTTDVPYVVGDLSLQSLVEHTSEEEPCPM